MAAGRDDNTDLMPPALAIPGFFELQKCAESSRKRAAKQIGRLPQLEEYT
jgi:hypothetical protein